MIRVLVVDDHPVVRQGLVAVLEDVPDFAVVGAAESAEAALALTERERPDVVLLDLRMPELNGLALLELIRDRHPTVKAVILSAFGDQQHIRAAFDRGAISYIVKSVNPIDLPSALRQALEATVYHGLGVARGGDASRDGSGLTERELAMLKALARGLSNQAIGRELWVSEQTVKFHLTNVYRKLGVANRTEAARYAFERGLAESYS